MGAVKLKIREPIIHGFGHQCAVYSILSAYPETEPWLNCNYIQIFTLRNLHTAVNRLGTLDFCYHYYGDFNLYEMKANPWLKFMSIPIDMIKSRWYSKLDFVKECIKKGYYVFLVLDHAAYRERKETFYHNAMIWGYDDDTETVYVADNNSVGKFAFEEISYTDFELASDVPEEEFGVGDHIGQTDGVYFFKVVVDQDKHVCGTNHLMQMGKLCYELEQYLDPPIILPDYTYGIDCYKELEEYYLDVARKRYEYCDIRAMCSLLDHKVLMTRRLRYLYKNGYLIRDYENKYYETVEKKTLILRNLLIKENVRGCKDFQAEKLCALLREVKNKEFEILSDVAVEIKKYLDEHKNEYKQYYMKG